MSTPKPVPSYRDIISSSASARTQTAGAAQPTPPNFPADIPVKQVEFENWALAIDVKDVWEAIALEPEDVATLANWAAAEGYQVRASGHSHNWSPLVIPNGADINKVLLVDTSNLSGLLSFDKANSTATFGTGTTIENATLLLQNLDNGGASSAPGYSWQNFTAPGALSLGGTLAIDAHGTGVPFNGQAQPLNGTLSNLVTSFKAVVTDPNGSNPNEYVIKEFNRTDADAPAFLVHLGRAFLTEVTMKVIPNYFLEVENSYPDGGVLFEASTKSPSPQSISALLDTYGRVEVIWFPFTDNPWVKTWKLISQYTQTPVSGPYNYPWANNISLTMNAVIRDSLFALPPITPKFGQSQLGISQFFAPAGAKMQGTARDLLLYVQDSTLRVTAEGYAIQIRRDQVQETASAFYNFYKGLLNKYQNKGIFGEFPINGPVEMRWTTMDFADELGIPGAQPPALSCCHSINPSDKTLDTVFWVDGLTIPGTKYSSDFFTELEEWFAQEWGTPTNNIMRPEWSKGWAYTPANGPWTNQQILTQTIPAQYNQPSGTQTFTWAQQTLAKYDKSHIYSNAFLDVLLPG